MGQFCLISILRYILVISLCYLLSSAEWVKRSVTTSVGGASYAGVVWVNSSIVLASGFNLEGYIIRSSDGGLSW